MRGGALVHEGKERTDDVDIYATPSRGVVIVRVGQGMVIAGQLDRRRDPAKTPGRVGPVKNLSQSCHLARAGGRGN